MARKLVNVTPQVIDPAQIPEAFIEGGVVLSDLEIRGVVQEAETRLKVRRQGGYAAVDLWLVVLLFLAWKGRGGLKTFWKKVRRHVKALAGAGGRDSLPSPSAVSRGLGSVETELVREATPWLLTEAPDLDEVLRHPAAQSWDARGAGWHVFDVDPTVRTLRHRALPVDDELPEAMRRSEETGVQGHSGRKRGDIQFRRTDVQHAGSGLWVHAHLHRGNGEGVVDFGLGLDGIVTLLDRLDLPRDRALVRMDGEHGSVPYFSACRERSLPFVTRLNRSKLYEDPQVLERLREATWYRVPDSLSGPVRAATDLGVLVLQPGSKTRRPDGTRYEPVNVRVVASIFPRGEKVRVGRLLDGWQVELYAVDLPADTWPAPEAVAAYHGRSSEENRLAQEDREVGLDRILSYHLPGQEFATLVGLFWLNYQTARGFELERPPAVRPATVLRRPVVDDRVPEAWPRDPVVTKLLDELDWTSLLARRPGWSWDAASGLLHCPEGRDLVLTTVRAKAHAKDTTGIVFCRPKGGCEACGVRDQCFHSVQPLAAKHAEVSVPSSVADRLRERLALVRGRSQPTKALDLRPIDVAPGLHAVLPPLFLPTEARRRFREVFDHATLRVEVDVPPPEPPRPRLVASDDKERQHRRQTWAVRGARTRLPEEAVVRVEASGRADLAHLLRMPRPLEVDAATTA